MSGNTAPYMLYAFVRIKGIQRKASEAVSMNDDPKLVLHQAEEVALAKHILRFEEILKEIEADLYPNKVTGWLEFFLSIIYLSSYASIYSIYHKSSTNFTRLAPF